MIIAKQQIQIIPMLLLTIILMILTLSDDRYGDVYEEIVPIYESIITVSEELTEINTDITEKNLDEIVFVQLANNNFPAESELPQTGGTSLAIILFGVFGLFMIILGGGLIRKSKT